MNCLSCQSDKLSVIDSRDCENSIRRRRVCNNCHFRFTTYERIEVPNVTVIKKDGRREKFNKEKLNHGMMQACKNRPIDQIKIQTIADKIENEINMLGEDELPSHYIGERVLSSLKELDPVAYMRFASVHKSFADLKAFEREIDKFKNNNILPT